MRNHGIDLDLALHVPVDDFWHVGAPSSAAKRGALPDPAGDELKGPGRDLRASRRDADDDRLTPAAMAGLQRLTHDGDVAGAVEGVIGAANLIGARFGHVNQVRDEVLAELFRIDEMGHAEALAPGLAIVIDIDADDHVGAGKPKPLQHVKPDAAEAEYDRLGALLDFRGVDDRADACGDAAA